jgi:hypothetical protein
VTAVAGALGYFGVTNLINSEVQSHVEKEMDKNYAKITDEMMKKFVEISNEEGAIRTLEEETRRTIDVSRQELSVSLDNKISEGAICNILARAREPLLNATAAIEGLHLARTRGGVLRHDYDARATPPAHARDVLHHRKPPHLGREKVRTGNTGGQNHRVHNRRADSSEDILGIRRVACTQGHTRRSDSVANIHCRHKHNPYTDPPRRLRDVNCHACLAPYLATSQPRLWSEMLICRDNGDFAAVAQG